MAKSQAQRKAEKLSAAGKLVGKVGEFDGYGRAKRKRRYLLALAATGSHERACKLTGISYKTAWWYKQDADFKAFISTYEAAYKVFCLEEYIQSVDDAGEDVELRLKAVRNVERLVTETIAVPQECTTVVQQSTTNTVNLVGTLQGTSLGQFLLDRLQLPSASTGTSQSQSEYDGSSSSVLGEDSSAPATARVPLETPPETS